MYFKFKIWFYNKLGMWNLGRASTSLLLSESYKEEYNDFLEAHNYYMYKIDSLRKEVNNG